MPIDPRDQLIAELQRALSDANARLAQMATQIATLTAVIARLSKTSRNSSLPPSHDPPGTARPTKPPTGRTRGGQRGHKGSRRELLPAAQVTEIIDHAPTHCDGCAASLPVAARLGQARRAQVIDLPPIVPHVVEHRAHSARCACGHTTHARLPATARHTFGPSVASFVALMTGQQRLSKRNVRALLSELLGIDVSLGEVINLEQRVSAALSAPYAEAHAAIKVAPYVCADETGWRENKRRAWLWLATSDTLAVYRIDRTRGGPAARALLGDTFAGILSADRWSGYHWVDATQRQLCWAHLVRNAAGIVDRGGAGARFGQALLNHTKHMMRWWRDLHRGAIARDIFERRMATHRRAITKVLAWGRACPDDAGAMARDLTRLEPALWTFVDNPGVDLTNNLAERDLRTAVIWRKTSFGTDSERGSRFVERMLTASASLRKQGRSLLTFLAAALAVAGQPHRRAPSLLAVTA